MVVTLDDARADTQPDQSRPERSNSFDLLFRRAELTTGGERLHRYADYMAALTACDGLGG